MIVSRRKKKCASVNISVKIIEGTKARFSIFPNIPEKIFRLRRAENLLKSFGYYLLKAEFIFANISEKFFLEFFLYMLSETCGKRQITT